MGGTLPRTRSVHAVHPERAPVPGPQRFGAPRCVTVALAGFAASWLVYAAAALVPALWVWGRWDARGALLATVLGVSVTLGINQLLGLLWYEPRPFMIDFGHTLAAHAVENSFPSDHATFLWSLGFALIATRAARSWGVLVCLSGQSSELARAGFLRGVKENS